MADLADLAEKLAVQEHQIRIIDARLEKVETTLRKVEQWILNRQSTLEGAEKSADKTARRITIGIMLLAATASVISVFYKGTTQ